MHISGYGIYTFTAGKKIINCISIMGNIKIFNPMANGDKVTCLL